MKADLATTIVAATVGILVSYFVADFLIGDIEGFPLKTVDSSISADITEPNIEIFNFKALNPTVEVYVGDCEQYDENGECIDDNSILEEGTGDEVNQETE